MPFNMAMKQPNARIIGLEANHRIAVSVDGDGVTFCWHGGKVPPLTSILAFAACGPLANLELMPVKMERMDRGVEVVDYDLYDIAFVDHKGIDGSVNRGNCGIGSAECSE